MPLNNTVILDLSRLETGAIDRAGLAIAHVQMCLARGQRVVAVVGTDPRRAARDLVNANRLPPTAEPIDRAELIAAGAIEASEAFTEFLLNAGLDAVSGGIELFPATRGHPLDAEPRSASAAAFSEALEGNAIVVLPGGVGRDSDGNVTSTGSQSETLTALVLADRLGIPGFTPDLDATMGEPELASFGSRKASRFAERSGTSLEPASLQPAEANGPVRVAVFGDSPAAALVSLWSAALGESVEILETAPGELGDADVLIDLNERAADSYEISARALRTGRTVVSGNTALIAERGGGLAISALIGAGQLRAGATIGGCPELANVLFRVADWPGVRRVQGTFSPAGDRVLDLRAQGLTADDASFVAGEELGLSTEEIERAARGEDAMRTLGAIAQLGFGSPASVKARPRGPVHVSDDDLQRAAAQGRRYRIIATAERIGDDIALRVGPVPLRADDPLVGDEIGAVESVVETRTGQSIRASGRLRQPGSIAGAVLRDLLDSLRDPSPARIASPSDANAFGAIA